MSANKHELAAEQTIRLVEPIGVFAAGHRPMRAPAGSPDVHTAILPPGVAVAQGRVLLSEEWHLDLPTAFWRCRERGSLVLWRPALTLWIDVADHDGESATEYLERRLADVPRRATQLCRAQRGRAEQLSFRLPSSVAPCAAMHALIVGPQSHVQAHAYFDRETEAAAVQSLLETVGVAPPFGLPHWASA